MKFQHNLEEIIIDYNILLSKKNVNFLLNKKTNKFTLTKQSLKKINDFTAEK